MSTEIDDGGPAFPTPDFHLAHERGMSLRDYFAAAALTGLLAHERYGSESPNKLADYAYDQADMMLARRGAKSASRSLNKRPRVATGCWKGSNQ